MDCYIINLQVPYLIVPSPGLLDTTEFFRDWLYGKSRYKEGIATPLAIAVCEKAFLLLAGDRNTPQSRATP